MALIAILSAALIVPGFVDWSAYRSTFEREAETILGQPVHVRGDEVEVSILPMPRLVFSDVEVGDREGGPMATVERFTVNIELMPLLKGEFRIAEMVLDQPRVRIAVADDGQIDWLLRSEASKALDPDSVVLSRVVIRDGALDYVDARSGARLRFTGINTNTFEARSLSGPWRLDGTLVAEDVPTGFRLSTSRRLDDGSMRLSAAITPSPAFFAGTLTLEGLVAIEAQQPVYRGAFSFRRFGPMPEAGGEGVAGQAPPVAWRTEGRFALKPDRVEMEDFALATGNIERGLSLNGNAMVSFGSDSRFSLDLTARQLDLDRNLAGGADAPFPVRTAFAALLAHLDAVPMPAIPGRVGLNLPTVLVGGAVVQGLEVEAETDADGWTVDRASATLPGRSEFRATGHLTTGPDGAFSGRLRLASEQPNVLSAWLGGTGSQAGRRRPPVDIGAQAVVRRDRIALETISGRLGETQIGGTLAWRAPPRGKTRIDAEFSGDVFALDDLVALASVVAGRAGTERIAEEFALKLDAGTVRSDQVTMTGVSLDIALAGDALTVNSAAIEDMGGASVTVASGAIRDLSERPNGRIEGVLEATSLEGVAGLARALAPQNAAARWLEGAARTLVPARLGAVVSAASDGSGLAVSLDGDFAGTRVEGAKLVLDGQPADWMNGTLALEGRVRTEDSAKLAAQLGFDVLPVAYGGGAMLALKAEGKADDALSGRIDGLFAGATLGAEGTFSGLAGGAPTLRANVEIDTGDLDPVLVMAGIAPPGVGQGTPARFLAEMEAGPDGLELHVTEGEIAGSRVDGTLTLASAASGQESGGTISVDALHLGWLAALGLGVEPVPLDGETSWSREALAPPALAGLRGKLDIEAERLTLGEDLAFADTVLTLSLDRDVVGLDMHLAKFAGGTARGGFSIRNPSGEAAVSGHIALEGVSLDPLVWRDDGRAVATGRVDLVADFEAAGGSVAALVANLAGKGDLALREARLSRLSPAAFEKAAGSASGAEALEEDALARRFAAYLDEGALAFDRLDGTFSIAGGILRARNMLIETPEATSFGGATIDLNRLALESRWSLAGRAEAGEPEGTAPKVDIGFAGPLAAPARQVDVSAFLAHLTVREVERLERLRQEEIEREEARKAAEAEQARQKAIEEARLRREAEAAERMVREQEEAVRRRAREAPPAIQDVSPPSGSLRELPVR